VWCSMKFGSKLMYLDYLHQLAQHLQLDQLIIPPAVRKYVSSLSSLSMFCLVIFTQLCTNSEAFCTCKIIRSSCVVTTMSSVGEQ